MKKITKIVTVSFFLLVSLSVNSFAAISYFSAGAGPSDWLNPNTWTPVGIPTNVDNVTISAGHTVQISLNGGACLNLTINGSLIWTSNKSLSVHGNYTVSASGIESAPSLGKITFFAPGTTVTVLGSSHPKLYYNFASDRTIAAGSVITKTGGITQIAASKTVTNLGSLTLGSFNPSAGAIFINGTNASLSLFNSGFMSGKIFTANATGNTVIIRYATGAIPTPTSSFFNLTLNATTSGIKTLPTNIVVANNLIINSSNTLNSNNFDLSVGGNWTNSGIFTASAGKTVTFNGTAAQTVSNTAGTTTFKGIK